MKVYFAFTIAGDRSTLEHAKRIVELLESMGHEVITKHFLREDVFELDRLISPQEVFHRDMKWLQQCDIFMAEVSGSSFGTGFEAGYILGSTDKKAVLFYHRERDGKISLTVRGNTHPNCTVVPYSSFGDVEEFIRKNL